MADENQNEKAEDKSSETASEQTEETSDAEKVTSDGASDTQKNAEEKTEEKAESTPEEKIAALEKEISDLKTQALYRAAENDNWRKRMMQQKDDAVAYANASLLSDLLESLDNFDRTVEASKDAKDTKTIADGITIISKNLVSMLENKYGLASFGKEGDEFNPDEHEAIGRMEDENAEKETLKQVYLKGYKLNGKIIRHAKVMVSVPKNK